MIGTVLRDPSQFGAKVEVFRLVHSVCSPQAPAHSPLRLFHAQGTPIGMAQPLHSRTHG